MLFQEKQEIFFCFENTEASGNLNPAKYRQKYPGMAVGLRYVIHVTQRHFALSAMHMQESLALSLDFSTCMAQDSSIQIGFLAHSLCYFVQKLATKFDSL